MNLHLTRPLAFIDLETTGTNIGIDRIVEISILKLLPDGTEKDFTKSQFGDRYPAGLKTETRTRNYVLSYPETVVRYKLLAKRLKEVSDGQ